MKLNLNKTDISLLLIRIVAGFAFLTAAIAKIFWTNCGTGATHAVEWTPASNLANGGGGIFHSMFTAMGTATWTAPLGLRFASMGEVAGARTRSECRREHGQGTGGHALTC